MLIFSFFSPVNLGKNQLELYTYVFNFVSEADGFATKFIMSHPIVLGGGGGRLLKSNTNRFRILEHCEFSYGLFKLSWAICPTIFINP